MRVGELLANWRFLAKMNLRDASAKIGISASTLMWLEKGKVPDGATLLKLQAWLFGAEPQAVTLTELVTATHENSVKFSDIAKVMEEQDGSPVQRDPQPNE